MRKDYYAILGVSKNASEQEIRQAFRKLAHKYHPDKKEGDEKKFKEINEACQVLSNRSKRQQYDAFGTAGSARGASGFEDIFSGGGFNADVNFEGSMGDIFHKIFRTMHARGRNITIDTTISFEESVYGVNKEMLIPYRRKASEKVSFSIPPGVESGMQIQIAGRGEPAEEKGLPAGDLFVRISVTSHKNFSKQDGELLYKLKLRFTESILGTKKEIKNVRGDTITIAVPKGSKDGTIFAVAGQGIPRPQGTGRLLVICNVDFPKTLSRKAKDAFTVLEKEGW